MYQITLTRDQAVTLEMYIRMTKDYRGKERQACEELGAERNEDGSLKYKNMLGNAEWWKDTETKLQEVLAAVNAAEWIREEPQ